MKEDPRGDLLEEKRRIAKLIRDEYQAIQMMPAHTEQLESVRDTEVARAIDRILRLSEDRNDMAVLASMREDLVPVPRHEWIKRPRYGNIGVVRQIVVLLTKRDIQPEDRIADMAVLLRAEPSTILGEPTGIGAHSNIVNNPVKKRVMHDYIRITDYIRRVYYLIQNMPDKTRTESKAKVAAASENAVAVFFHALDSANRITILEMKADYEEAERAGLTTEYTGIVKEIIRILVEHVTRQLDDKDRQTAIRISAALLRFPEELPGEGRYAKTYLHRPYYGGKVCVRCGKRD